MRENTIILGGRQWPLRYELPDALAIEARFRSPTGVSVGLLPLLGSVRVNGSLEVLVAVLTIGLQKSEPRITEKKVLDMLAERMAGMPIKERVQEIYNPVLIAASNDLMGTELMFEEESEGKAQGPRAVRPAAGDRF